MPMVFKKKSRLTPLDQWRMYFNWPHATPEQLAERAKVDITHILVIPPQQKRSA